MSNPDRPRGPIVAVPVRVGSAGERAVWMCRGSGGVRTGVAFSSTTALRAVMGVDHPYLEMSLPALRLMLVAVGVDRLQLDPDAVRRPVAGLRVAS